MSNNLKDAWLFIVEGLSDKDVLEPILSELIDDTKLYFAVLRCDATVSNDFPYNGKNMKERITIILNNYTENNRGIKREYIKKIIYITDTDGCYIDNGYIYYSKDYSCFRYEDDGIYTDRPNDAINRNETKSKNLDIINSTSKVCNILIGVYYFSCNLDHVLYNIRNLDQSLKEEYAIEFADQYENRELDFIKFIQDDMVNLGNDYHDSWKKIKVDLNSIKRFSNFYQFFIDNYMYLKDEVKLLIDGKE